MSRIAATLLSMKPAASPGSRDALRVLARFPGAAFAIDPVGVLSALNAEARLLLDDVGPRLSMLRERGDGEVDWTALFGSEEHGIDVVSFPAGFDDLTVILCRNAKAERNLRDALAESRQRYKHLVEISSDFAWETDDGGRFVFVSPGGALGYTAKDLVGLRAERLLVRLEGDAAQGVFDTQEPVDRLETWFHRKDGTPACVLVSCLPLFEPSGRWCGVRGVCREITEERERETALANVRNRERLHAFILKAMRDEAEPEKMLAGTAQALRRAMSADGCQIFRFHGVPRHVPDAEVGDCPDPDGVAGLLERLRKDPRLTDLAQAERLLLAVGTRYRRDISGAVCVYRAVEDGAWTDDERETLEKTADQIAVAIEQVGHLEAQRRLANTDPLTGLLNRRAFFDDVARRNSRGGAAARRGALVYVDLDNFKLVNDSHGHQRGDEVLRTVAGILADCARSGDLAARIGGDEFALWLDRAGAEEAAKLAERLLERIAELRHLSPENARPLGFSIGISVSRNGAEPLQTIVDRADAAMYVVKKNGKGGYQVADDGKGPAE